MVATYNNYNLPVTFSGENVIFFLLSPVHAPTNLQVQCKRKKKKKLDENR